MKQQKSAKKKPNFLPIAAAVVAVAALAVTFYPKHSAENLSAPTIASGSDLTVQMEKIGTNASYFDSDADGSTVEVLAVRASDDTVRFALNTCQVCNGSPYAYFEQDGDTFICQNCRNRFASAEVGKESGGCNPVPITEDTYQAQEDGTVTIPSAFLEENAARFANWKKF